MLARPWPSDNGLVAAGVTPSSVMQNRSRSPSRSSDNCTLAFGPACLAAFCSASRQQKYTALSMAGSHRPTSSIRVRVGRAARCAASVRATASPRSTSRGGAMPCASARSSTMAASTSAPISCTSASARRGSLSSSRAVTLSFMRRAMSRCWAPSCRSRSMRWRSASTAEADRAPAALISASSRWLSSAICMLLATDSSNMGSSSSALS